MKSDKFLKVYSNSVQMEVNPYDIRLTFGEATRSSSGKMTIEQLVTVVMSPPHAKAFLGVFAANLREYEKQVGTINLPAPPQGPAEAEKQPIKATDKQPEKKH